MEYGLDNDISRYNMLEPQSSEDETLS